MSLSEPEELEYLRLKKQKAMSSGSGIGMNDVMNAIPGSSLTGIQQAGSMAGQFVGAAIGGYPGAVAGGGIGAAVPDVTSNPALSLLSMQYPKARQQMTDQATQAFKGGAGQSALFEGIPVAWRGAKAAGRGVMEGMGALEGVGERLRQFKGLPFTDKLNILRPGESPIPTPEIAGAQQGAVQDLHGIPDAKSMVDEGKAIGASKTTSSVPTSYKKMGGYTVQDLQAILKSQATPEAKAAAQAALDEASGGAGAGAGMGSGSGAPVPPSQKNPADIALAVSNTLKAGGKPTVQDAVVAARHYGEILATKTKLTDVQRAVLTDSFGNITDFLKQEIPEVRDAMSLTHKAHLRDELMKPFPTNSGTGEPNRFSLLRALWLTGSLFTPGGMGAKAAMMALPMSPYVGALATTAGEAMGPLGDKLLLNKGTPLVARALANIRGRQQQ